MAIPIGNHQRHVCLIFARFGDDFTLGRVKIDGKVPIGCICCEDVVMKAARSRAHVTRHSSPMRCRPRCVRTVSRIHPSFPTNKGDGLICAACREAVSFRHGTALTDQSLTRSPYDYRSLRIGRPLRQHRFDAEHCGDSAQAR
jgi:hypothetical protein